MCAESNPSLKRASSFSTPRPTKSQRMTLRRTESYITLPIADSAHSSSTSTVPYNRTLRHYKEQRERRKQHLSIAHTEPALTFTPTTISLPIPKSAPSPKPLAMPRTRTSSPLAPARTPLPPRAAFPRSKPEPDLYRVAITTRMRDSPAGQKILNMGPRLALSILSATRELERIVAARMDDVEMNDSPLSNSWIVVPGEDWEMVDCAA